MISTREKIIGMMQAAGLTPSGLSSRLQDAEIMSASQAKNFLRPSGGDTTTTKADAIVAWLIEYLNQKGK